MEELLKYLPFIIPILILEMILLITSLVSVLKSKKYKFGNKVLWVILVVFVQIVGPVIYFIFGRDDD